MFPEQVVRHHVVLVEHTSHCSSQIGGNQPGKKQSHILCLVVMQMTSDLIDAPLQGNYFQQELNQKCTDTLQLMLLTVDVRCEGISSACFHLIYFLLFPGKQQRSNTEDQRVEMT